MWVEVNLLMRHMIKIKFIKTFKIAKLSTILINAYYHQDFFVNVHNLPFYLIMQSHT